MSLRTLSTHTIDDSMLPLHYPVVLDVGCRNYDFTAGILGGRPDARIICLDPDPDMHGYPYIFNTLFLRVALVGDGRTEAGYAAYSTGEGNFLTEAERYYDARMLRVSCTNITALMRMLDIEHWDLVKLDCEGSEFQILENWPGPIATQISVEFHDHDRPEKDDAYYDWLWQEKLPWYEVRQHELSVQGTGCGHWDTVLALRRPKNALREIAG